MVNDDSVTNSQFWRAAGTIYATNRRRANDGLPRVSWNSGEFEWCWKRATKDPSIYSKALLGLTDEAKVALSPMRGTPGAKKQQSGLRDRYGALIQCYECKQNHYKANCPIVKSRKASNAQKQQGAAGRPNFTSKTFRRNQQKYQRQYQYQQQQRQQTMHSVPYPPMYAPYPTPLQHQQRYAPTPGAPWQAQYGGQYGQQQMQNPPKKVKRNEPGAAFYIPTPQGLMLRPEVVGKDVCRYFDDDALADCHYTNEPMRCRDPHYCRVCKAVDHNATNCRKAAAQQFAGPPRSGGV